MALDRYTNPQRVINKSFDAFIDGGNDIVNKVAKTGVEVADNIRKEKAYMQKQAELQSAQMQTMYSKVNEIGSTGNASLDENILAFWNEKADDYFKIKNAMDQGVISKQEGNRALAKINGLIPQFKEQAKYLAEQSAAYKQDLADGKVSSVGSIQNKNILSALGNGSNVGIIERGGKLYYYKPGEDGEEGSMINGGEMIAKAQVDENLYRTIPDVSGVLTSAFDKTYQPESLESKYVKTVDVKRGDPIPGNTEGAVFNNIPEGEIYTYQIIEDQGKIDGQAAMLSNGTLDPIINNDEIMVSTWQDTVPDEWLAENYPDNPELVDSRWNDFPPDMSSEEKSQIQQLQRDAAKKYLAEKAYEDNASMDNKLKFMQKRKDSKGDGGGSTKSRFTTTQQLVYDTRKGDYANIMSSVDEAYANGTPDPQTFANLLDSIDPDGGYFVNDDGLVQDHTKVINISDDPNVTKRLLNSKSGIDRQMQIIFDKEGVYKPTKKEEPEEEESEVTVNQTTTVPKGANVYKKDDGTENIFEGILTTQAEIDNFNEEYTEEDLKEHPLYDVDQAASALSHLKPADVSIGQWKQDPRVVAQSLRIIKRKLAKADIEDDPDYFK